MHVFQEESEDIKRAIRIRKSKKDRQYNGQKKKDKITNNDAQNITQKTKNQAALTQHNNKISQYCKMVMHSLMVK